MNKFNKLPHDKKLFVEGLFYKVLWGLAETGMHCDPISAEAKELREAITTYFESQKP